MASTRRSRREIVREVLTRQVDPAPVVFFRVLFGILMVVEVIRYWAHGRIARYYIEPTFFFSFVEWIRPVGVGMYPVFLLMGVAALFLAIGYHYRAASVLYFLLYTYTFLLDKAQYNNHYYLVCLLAFLFAVTDADRGFSIDAVRRRLPSVVPAWQVYLFRLQVCVVFFYAGVAKINSDWLSGEPVRAWLAARSDYFLIGPLLLQEWVVFLYAYTGLFFDLGIGFALLWSRTRGAAFVLLLGFNLLNKWFYDIGIFPYLAMATFVLFMDGTRIRGLFGRWVRTRAVGGAVVRDLLGERVGTGANLRKPKPWTELLSRLGRVGIGARAVLISGFVVVQLLAPLRHFAIPGNVAWTEEGHLFSWRMKLRDKRSDEMVFHTRDPQNGAAIDLSTDELTKRQKRKMSTRPHMIIQYARHLAGDLRRMGIEKPAVYVRTSVSLNSRDPEPLIDETADLANVQYRSFVHNGWITTLE